MENEVTGIFNTHFSGATLLGVRMVSSAVTLEGGLLYVFKKEGILSTLVLGYNDLGEWVDYLSIGEEVVTDKLCSAAKINIIKEYVTAIAVMYEAGQVF